MKPKFMLASTAPVPIPDDHARRDALADWLTSKDNPFFAKAIANRDVELLLRQGHHRSGGRYPRVQSARRIPRCSTR